MGEKQFSNCFFTRNVISAGQTPMPALVKQANSHAKLEPIRNNIDQKLSQVHSRNHTNAKKDIEFERHSHDDIPNVAMFYGRVVSIADNEGKVLEAFPSKKHYRDSCRSGAVTGTKSHQRGTYLEVKSDFRIPSSKQA